jgi:hypothetical protein
MVIMHKWVAFRNTVKRLSSCICVRDSDPLGQDSRQSCGAVYGSEAWFWEVSGKRKRSWLLPEYSPTRESGERPKRRTQRSRDEVL